MIAPRTRRAGRERAVQFLFGLDFSGYEPDDTLGAFWDMSPSKPAVRRYAETLAQGVWRNRDELDHTINGALEGWLPERVGYIERAVLRVAVFEMRHLPDVPPGVAINEAIEVAKTFGGEDAPRFVNGVLDRIRRDLDTDTDQGAQEQTSG